MALRFTTTGTPFAAGRLRILLIGLMADTI
jgi:hypothetical protein